MAAIYWLASATNPRVSTLQSGINTVLRKHGYLPISVTGRLDGRTCGGLVLCGSQHMADLQAAVPADILVESTNTCKRAKDGGGQFVLPSRDPNYRPPEATPAPVVQTPAPAPAPTPVNIVSNPVVISPPVQESTPAPVVATPAPSSGYKPNPSWVAKCKEVGGNVDGNQCVFGDIDDTSADFCDLQALYEGTCAPKKASMLPWIAGFGVLAIGAAAFVVVSKRK